MANSQYTARYLAIDITTTEMALAVRDDAGHEDFARLVMRGATHWRNSSEYPGFLLDEIPVMISELLAELVNQGWSFHRSANDPGYLSVACRQHDQVVLDKADRPLLPALMWKCNAAAKEVAQLQDGGAEATVGPLAPRFVLPKLKHVLAVAPELKGQVQRVMLTGDWVALCLTGKARLAKSDALSNGLLDQKTRQLAVEAIEIAGLAPEWFPEPAQSGAAIGEVLPARSSDDPWRTIKEQLAGWIFAAGLGDNHASAVGCGMTDDYRRIVVSAGTSGTINWSCDKETCTTPSPDTYRFEFYEQSSLLLKMLADCGAWYSRYFHEYAADFSKRLGDLNRQMLDVELGKIRRVLHDDGKHFETFPPGWAGLSLGAKTACTQFSIALELLLRVEQLIAEASPHGGYHVDTYVLTGGLSQSTLFQQFFAAGVHILAPQARVAVSGRTGPLRFKTSAYGALVNAEFARVHSLAAIFGDTARFPLLDCAAFDPLRGATAEYLLRAAGLG